MSLVFLSVGLFVFMVEFKLYAFHSEFLPLYYLSFSYSHYPSSLVYDETTCIIDRHIFSYFSMYVIFPREQ